MKIRSEANGESTLVRVEEERLDAANAADFKAFLAGLIQGGATAVGVDLTRVAFVDSSGLGALVSGRKRLGDRGQFALWGMTPQVRSLFELTQLYKVFEIYQDEADAVSHLR